MSAAPAGEQLAEEICLQQRKVRDKIFFLVLNSAATAPLLSSLAQYTSLAKTNNCRQI